VREVLRAQMTAAPVGAQDRTEAVVPPAQNQTWR
jgi:hypothetical protein